MQRLHLFDYKSYYPVFHMSGNFVLCPGQWEEMLQSLWTVIFLQEVFTIIMLL